MKGLEVLFSKKSDEWETPNDLYQELDNEFHFDLDAAASDVNHKCDLYIKEDALNMPWYGKNIFCNPPYSQWQKFVKKAFEENQKYGSTIVLLLPSRTDTKAFHEFIYKNPHAEIRFIKGRLKFGDSKNSAPFPSMIVIFR